jgi:hypothetical protein
VPSPASRKPSPRRPGRRATTPVDASRPDGTRLDASRRAVWLPGSFNRWANRRFVAWRSLQTNFRHQTTTARIAQMAEDHDRRAVLTLTARSLRFRRFREWPTPATRGRIF